jgi:hypothetical protein
LGYSTARPQQCCQYFSIVLTYWISLVHFTFFCRKSRSHLGCYHWLHYFFRQQQRYLNSTGSAYVAAIILCTLTWQKSISWSICTYDDVNRQILKVDDDVSWNI